MGNSLIKCKKCGVYLSRKKSKLPEKLCNRCGGVNYSPKQETGRKILH